MSQQPKYISLEPAAFLSDPIVQVMSAEEVGVYWLLCCNLYVSGGRLKYDLNILRRLCKVNGDFVFDTVLSKFKIRGNYLTQKRVTKELRRAQILVNRAVKAANTRWNKQCLGNAQAMQEQCQVTRRNVSEEKGSKVTNTNTKGMGNTTPLSDSFSHAPSLSDSSRTQADVLRLSQAIGKILLPKNNADRSAIDNLSRWAVENNCAQRVFDLAHEALKVKRINTNRFAYFFDTLQRELGYRAAAQRKGQ